MTSDRQKAVTAGERVLDESWERGSEINKFLASEWKILIIAVAYCWLIVHSVMVFRNTKEASKLLFWCEYKR